jgi:ABC-type amino acid transport substrate-binding protein
MKKNLILISVFILLIASIFSYKIIKNKKNEPSIIKKKIVFGLEIFPPFCFLDKDKNLAGFDIDLINQISKELNISPEFKLMNIDELIAGLDNNILDLAPNFIPTEKRKKNFIFSKNYVKSNICFIVNNKKNKSVKTLEYAIKKNLKFGVRPGSFEDIFLQKYYPKAKIIHYNAVPTIFQAYKTGIIDIVVSYKYIASSFIKENNMKNTSLIDINYDSDQLNFAFMFNKKNEILKNKIDLTLDKLKENGILDSLKKKYDIE